MNNLLKLSAIGALVTIGLVGFTNSAKAERISLLAGQSTLDESELIAQQPRPSLACIENGTGEVVLVHQQVQDFVHPYNTLLVVKTAPVPGTEPLPPGISFTRTLDSDHPQGAYMPKDRCLAIRDRLINLKNSIGEDQLADLSRTGKVNGQRVIAVNKVSSKTVVMTLSGENSRWKVAKYEVLPKFQALVHSQFIPAASGPIQE